MAAVSRLQRLGSIPNLIHRHQLIPATTSFAAAATSSVQPLNISPESQPSLPFDFQHLTKQYSDKNKLSSPATDFLLNWNFPFGVSALPTFDLSRMEVRGRSTSTKNRGDLEDDVEVDDDDDDDDDDESLGYPDHEWNESDSDDDEDDDYGRGGVAYRV